MRPGLAVAAVLAAVSVAAGAYYLWPKGRHVDPCAPQVPVSEAARQALESYAGRIRHDVDRTSETTRREETWYDPVTGAERRVSFDGDGRTTVEIGTTGRGKTAHSIWIAPEERTWYSTRNPAMLLPRPDAAAVEARRYRDRVAKGKAKVIARRRIRGREALELHETVMPLRLFVPGSPPPSRPAPRLQIETWVDPLTYVPLRTRTASGGRWSQVDSTWLPRTAANVASTKLVIPRDFRRTHPSITSSSGKVLVSRAGTADCGES
jgi:hypothetical protein